MNNSQLLIESIYDLKQDFEELEYLVKSNLYYLKQFQSDLEKVKKNILKKTYKLVLSNSNQLRKSYQKYLKNIGDLINRTRTNKYSTHLLDNLAKTKQEYFDLIRSQQTILGSLLTSLDWQSPSFAHTQFSQAGIQTGKISATINDYKRDTHLDEKEYEKLYLKEYIDARFKFNIHVYMTNSGQAAFTTILNFLIMEGKIKRKVILGQSAYFQYKQLVVKSLGSLVIEVDEFETENILNIIEREKSSVLFLDSLCNSKNIPVPNLEKIINYLIKNTKDDVYLVIDNTCLSASFQPFNMVIGKTRKVHLILFESLMKYLQLGLDRVTGGIIVATGRDTRKIFDYRKHSGTNILDSSVYAIPKPDRKILEGRLARYERNTLLLASYLNDYIKNNDTALDGIIYPGLTNHKSYQWDKDFPFHGCFFNLSFKKKYQSPIWYKKFIGLALREAKKARIELIGGTSFGLNTTRIYLTSLWTDYGEPFVRIAVGTENRLQIEDLKTVFTNAIEKFYSALPDFLLASLNRIQKQIGLK